MKILIPLLAGVLCVALGFAAETRTVRDGVYTKEQATRGAQVFNDACQNCHGDTESGGDYEPGVMGDGFVDHWNGKTVADLLRFISSEMPGDNPGALEPDQYNDVLAYVLSVNGYPAGNRELSPQITSLKEIAIVPVKK